MFVKVSVDKKLIAVQKPPIAVIRVSLNALISFQLLASFPYQSTSS